MRYIYPCVLTPEEEGGFFASFPDVPGALTYGDDLAETLEMAEDALVAILAVYVQEKQDIPTPSPVADGQELVAVRLLLPRPSWPSIRPCAPKASLGRHSLIVWA